MRDIRQKDIGEIYRDAFRNYTPAPPGGAWGNVARQLGQGKASGSLTWVKAFLGASAGVGLGYLVFSLWPAPDSPEPEQASVVIAYEAPSQVADTVIVMEPEEKAAVPEAGVEAKEKPVTAVIKVSDVQKKSEPSAAVTAPSPEPVEPAVVESPVKQNDKAKSSPVKDTPSAMDRHRIQRGGSNTSAVAQVSYSRDRTICKGEKLRIGASGGIGYQWSNGSTQDSILVEPELTSIYRVTVTRTDNRKVSGEIRVNVHDCSSLFVPNAFTPNGDGNNDEFIVYGTGIAAFRMVIQAVSGTILFETEDISEGWDGTYLGQAAETGTYHYRVDYIDELGNAHSRNGRLTLLR
jgi:gliding motility-associated-like protein